MLDRQSHQRPATTVHFLVQQLGELEDVGDLLATVPGRNRRSSTTAERQVVHEQPLPAARPHSERHRDPQEGSRPAGRVESRRPNRSHQSRRDTSSAAVAIKATPGLGGDLEPKLEPTTAAARADLDVA